MARYWSHSFFLRVYRPRRGSVSVHKHAKRKELSKYPAILTSHLVNNPIIFSIELTLSFLIGPKRTVKFRNQRLWRHLAADYTIIMWRTLKVTSNHVMCDRSAWFLRVIMSSSRALSCLPSVKRQKHDSHFFRSMYNKTIIWFGFLWYPE